MALPDAVLRYFATEADIEIIGEVVPNESRGNTVEHLIDGVDYFGSIKTEVERLLQSGNNRFFYFADWALGLVQGPISPLIGTDTSAWAVETPPEISASKPFQLDEDPTHPPLIDQLAEMNNQGIDVRALVWVHPIIMLDEGVSQALKTLWNFNAHTLLSLKALRDRSPDLRSRVIMNTLSHPLGAAHMKAVVCGDDSRTVAFLSGMDLTSGRLARHGHLPGAGVWHDAGVRIEGPAAADIYHYLGLLWTEQRTREPTYIFLNHRMVESHIPADPELMQSELSRKLSLLNLAPTPEWPHRPTLIPSPAGTAHVQVLRTLPTVNITGNVLVHGHTDLSRRDQLLLKYALSGSNHPRLSFAQSGVFEFRLGLKKAIMNAEHYIYIEDQGFFSFEIMDWIGAQLELKSALKVVLLYGADPADAPDFTLLESIGHRLLGPNSSSRADRVVFCKRGGGVTVHAKVTIIDDRWAAVGSANCMRRSLYTDQELSVSILDEAEIPFAKKLRSDLWLEHSSMGLAGSFAPREIESALGLWNPAWRPTADSDVAPIPDDLLLKPEIERMDLPFVVAPLGSGTIQLNVGGDEVFGLSTNWNSTIEGSFLLPIGPPETKAVQVLHVESATRLRLTKVFDGKTFGWRQYRISERGKWLLDSLPRVVASDVTDPDSRTVL